MHTDQNSLTHLVGRRPALLLSILALALASLVCVASAHAADGSVFPLGKYGEVPTSRFGGFDSAWWDNGHFDGGGTETAPAPGKFLYPVGFAVDNDAPGGTALYVLDRVSAPSNTFVQTTAPETRWRLQKLSATGAPLARTEFLLPKEVGGVLPGFSNTSSPVTPVGLAVSGGSVYTVISGSLTHGIETTPYAEEIVGWSTTPVGETLVPSAGAPDSVSSPVTAGSTTYAVPSVISTESDLQATPVFLPAGLTTDGAGSLALLGDANDPFATSPRTSQAPAVVERISIANGEETAGWSSTAQPGLGGDVAGSISTDPTSGHLDIALIPPGGVQADWDLVDLSSDLSTSRVLSSPALDPPILDLADPIDFYPEGFGAAPAASPVAALSNGLFAASYNESSSPYWFSQEGAIRLTSPLPDGALSTPTTVSPTTIYDTLGKTTTGACDIAQGSTNAGLSNVVLASGDDGSVWMLNVGRDLPSGHVGGEGAEFSPGAADPCVSPPAGTTFSLTDESTAPPTAHLASAGPLTVKVGTKVRFGTESFEYPTVFDESALPAIIYAFEWDPIGGSSKDTGYTLRDLGTDTGGWWPYGSQEVNPTIDEYLYTEPGVYTVKMKALGELGEYDASGTVVVQTASPPTAAFTLPATAQAGGVVNFDASGSTPASGANVVNYHWSFGDGGEDDTQTPNETHAFTAAGTYTVTLTVRDNDNQQSTVVAHQITVTVASTGTGTGTGTGGGSSTGGGGTTTTPSPPSGGSSTGGGAKPTPKPKPAPSKTQKLATALKQCKRKSPGKKRKACEKQAKAKYAPKKSKK